MWQEWIDGILGLWVLISPFLGFTTDQMTTNLVIVGIVMAVSGFWGAAQYRQEEQMHQHA